ncbi:MAG: hypothetical protein EP298_01450 [Gammaproteobacteria bacterium]|nr:MAG: hypothetical protein EP298_01450 [Gammaproteobacteria bacterium]UTW42015.1 hypothetical protein KFE69_10960 [bacterium SCSIO 12844]
MAKPVKTIISVVVVVAIAGGLYAWGDHYAQEKADVQAKALIKKIQQQSPDIKDITYHSINVGPLSFFTHHFSIDHVSMIIGSQPINIGSISVDDFVLDKNNKLNKVDVSFNHIALDLDKKGPAKEYLEILKTRKAQLKAILEKDQKENPKHLANEDIKAYVGWFEILDAMANKYATSYGDISFTYNSAAKTVSTDFNLWLKNNHDKPLIHIKSDLDNVSFATDQIDDILGNAKPQEQVIEFNFDHMLQSDSKASNEAVKAYLHDADPSLDMKLDYKPSTQAMNWMLNLDNSYALAKADISKQHYHGQLSLAGLTLNQYTLNDIFNQNKPLAGFEKAYVNGSNIDVDARFDFPKAFVLNQAANIGVQAIVAQLPYDRYDFYLKGKGAYNETSQLDDASLAFGIKDKLDMNVVAKTKVTSKLMVSDYVNMLTKAFDEQNQKNADQTVQGEDSQTDTLQSLIDAFNQSKVINEKMQLVDWQFTLENHNDFLEHMTKVASGILQTPEPQVKEMIKAIVDGVAQSQGDLLPVKAYQKEIDQFIDKPQRLKLSVDPKPPVTIAQFYQTMLDYMMYQQQKMNSQEQSEPDAHVMMVNKQKIDEKMLKNNIDQLNIKLTAE